MHLKVYIFKQVFSLKFKFWICKCKRCKSEKHSPTHEDWTLKQWVLPLLGWSQDIVLQLNVTKPWILVFHCKAALEKMMVEREYLTIRMPATFPLKVLPPLLAFTAVEFQTYVCKIKTYMEVYTPTPQKCLCMYVSVCGWVWVKEHDARISANKRLARKYTVLEVF